MLYFPDYRPFFYLFMIIKEITVLLFMLTLWVDVKLAHLINRYHLLMKATVFSDIMVRFCSPSWYRCCTWVSASQFLNVLGKIGKLRILISF